MCYHVQSLWCMSKLDIPPSLGIPGFLRKMPKNILVIGWWSVLDTSNFPMSWASHRNQQIFWRVHPAIMGTYSGNIPNNYGLLTVSIHFVTPKTWPLSTWKMIIDYPGLWVPAANGEGHPSSSSHIAIGCDRDMMLVGCWMLLADCLQLSWTKLHYIQ